MAHRYRLCPEAGQGAVLDRHCADARFVWNLALEQLNLRLPGRRPGSAERFRQLADARRGTWLGEGSSSVQQQALRDFDRAVANWLSGSHRRPRWRRRGLDEGFCVRDVHVHVLSRRWAQITVPKCGPVRFRLSRPLPDEHGMARITRDRAGRWHVSLTAPQPVLERERTGRTVGVDLGVAATVATSGGELLRCPWLSGEAQRLRRLERRKARQRKGSSRRERTKAAIAPGARPRRGPPQGLRRADQHPSVRDYDLIAIEDLRVRHMLRSAAGTREQPGTNVAQKRGTERSAVSRGRCSGAAWRTRPRPAASSSSPSTPSTPPRPAIGAGPSIPEAARAKRASTAATAGIKHTRTSTPPAISSPPDWRS